MPSGSNLPDWQRAHGSPVFQGLIKQTPTDFQVTEILGFDPSGDGEHDFLWLEKIAANTAWVARTLARHASVAERDVGFAGRKDRHAVTRQWFSVRRPGGAGTDWQSYQQPGVQLLEINRNQRKLKRGANRANRFRIAIRGRVPDSGETTARLQRIRDRGVPNYFGDQRFGRDGANLLLARGMFGGRRLTRDQRSNALSAARSFLFNQTLQARVIDQCWSRAFPGELLNLDGTGSVFSAAVIDADITARLRRLDIHPTGALWGRGDPGGAGQSVDYDRSAVDMQPDLAAGLEKFGLTQARRALRLNVRDLAWEAGRDALWLEFELASGTFATSVIREIALF